MENHSHNCL